MSADYSVHKDCCVVFTYAWGVLEKGDIITHRERLVRDPRFSLECAQIVDLCDATAFDVSSTSVWLLAEEEVFGPESRRAFVAESDLHYGMCRMFHAYSDGQNVRVFHHLAEAAEWVGVPVEVAAKAFAEIRSANGVA